jgi:hypothetical protein
MSISYENTLSDLQGLLVRGPEAQIVTWGGKQALRLHGLVVVPDISMREGWVEVEIGAEGTAYPGIVFHLNDVLNYELAYAQPHTSGAWDALQYDPIFHGVNTWQLNFGAGAQQCTEVPQGSWFTLRVDFLEDSAFVRVGDQEPLYINRLAHQSVAGLVGLWSYLPAHFRNLRLSDTTSVNPTDFPEDHPLAPPPGTIDEWFLDGYGTVRCEPGGILNLNRYLPMTVTEVQLIRLFEVIEATELLINCGFSDDLTLKLDDEVIFSGQHTYESSPDWADRGYVSPDVYIERTVLPGIHQLTAMLKVTEPFGWGLQVSILGEGIHLLPTSKVVV